MSDAFAGFENAPVYEKGVFLTKGNYKLEISKCLVQRIRSKGTDAFIAECKVIESDDPTNHPVGTKRTWMQNMGDTAVAFPAIKEFLYAALGYSWSTDKEEIKAKVDPQIKGVLIAATDETKNALKGRQIKVEVFPKITKVNQKPFNQHIFAPAMSKLV